MLFYIYIFFLSLIILSLNSYLVKKEYLISVSGDSHQKFASKNKTPLTGGIFVFLSLLFHFNEYDKWFILFSFLILFLGIISDLKFIKSAKKRLFFQLSIVLSFVIIGDIQIINTRIDVLDSLLTNHLINYMFVCFCILIVINGSNFFDGLNTLSVGYYLSVISIIVLLISLNYFEIEKFLIFNLALILFLVFFFNLINKIFIGDSGSYLLGFIFSIILINFYDTNSEISPFFIILLLWYPSYETLFSMIRKNLLNRSPMKPDSNHLHQLIFYFLKQKYTKKILLANLSSATIINLYNLMIFLVGSQFIFNTQIQIILILLNLFLYTVIYFKLFLFRYKKL